MPHAYITPPAAMFLLMACTNAAEAPPADTADTAPLSHAPDPTCTALGCLRAERSYGTYTRAEIEPYLYNGVTIDNGYEVVAIEYLTEIGPATATVTLPSDLRGETPVEGFPLVVNAHGTVGLDDPCQLTGTVSGTGLAALFGGRGTIGIAPDYPGLGTPGYHRYLDARTEATSVLDSLRAALHLAQHRNIATAGRAAVVGLSQGGHAVLSAATLHSRYAPELDIRAFGASGPASLYEDQWRSGVLQPGPHLVMHAMMAWSFAEVSGEDRSDMWASNVASTVDQHLTERCYWSPSFGPEPVLTDDFPTVAEEVFSDDFLSEYSTGDWDTYGFIEERFAANRVEPWLDEGEQTAPIAIWQGTADTTVPAWTTRAMVDDLRTGGVEVTLNMVAGGTHTDTAFGFLAYPELATDESVAWVLGLLDGP